MSGGKPEDAGLRTQTQEADDGELNHKLLRTRVTYVIQRLPYLFRTVETPAWLC